MKLAKVCPGVFVIYSLKHYLTCISCQIIFIHNSFEIRTELLLLSSTCSSRGEKGRFCKYFENSWWGGGGGGIETYLQLLN